MQKVFFVALLLVIGATVAFANVMVFDVGLDTSGIAPKISYRLNEAAETVDIQIFGPLPATTVIRNLAGPTSKGYNEILWDGLDNSHTPTNPADTYGFKIVASVATGYSTWTKISDDSNLIFSFEYPRGGVTVNRNLDSPYFGMVYVANTRDLPTASGRPCGDGIYALYPDGSDPLGMGNIPAAGGVDWSLSIYSSPYKMFISEDDLVWIADYSDGHSGLWRANPDLSGNFTEILSPTLPAPIDAKGLNAAHGSISGVYVEGAGSSTVLYTWDEDLPDATTDPGLKNFYKYEIGNGPFPWTTVGTIQIDERNFSSHPRYDINLGMFVNAMHGKFTKDSAGNWWVSNYRANLDVPVLMQITADGTTMLWDSITNGTGNSSEPLMFNQGGFAIDEARNRIIVASNSIETGAGGFNVFPFSPLPSGDLVSQITKVSIPGATSTRGCDIDAAGNVYIACNVSELLHIYSPPGPNSFTKDTGFTMPGGQYIVAAKPQWKQYE